MLTCIIRYHIDPTKHAQFARYARNRGTAIPRRSADTLGRENDAFARSENFLLREDRTFLKCVSTPQQGALK